MLGNYTIKIACKNPPSIPSHIDYRQHDERFWSGLWVRIFDNEIEIGRGYILDFYSNFINGKYEGKSQVGGGHL